MLSSVAVQSNDGPSGDGGKKTDFNRGPLLRTAHPRPEAIWIFASLASPDGTLSIVADGKQYTFTLNRRQILGLAAQAFEGLKNMEPGK